MNTVQIRTRSESPARWMKAAERAVGEGIRISQVQSTGQWIATSGTDATVAYAVEIAGNVAFGCDCLAAINGDSVCKHRAAFYLLIGSINLDPEPGVPAPVLTAACRECSGAAVTWDREIERLGLLYPALPGLLWLGHAPGTDDRSLGGSGLDRRLEWLAY